MVVVVVGFSGGSLGGLRGGLEVGEVEEGLQSSFGSACFFFLFWMLALLGAMPLMRFMRFMIF